jgi:hypothetical protein
MHRRPGRLPGPIDRGGAPAQTKTDTAHVQPHLVEVFRRYGLPAQINADNGPPWGSPRSGGHSLSDMAIWLIRLGVRMSFSAPYHPQTNGKLERFHRTLDVEAIAGQHFCDSAAAQRKFDDWRSVYNCQRPHEALGMQVPVQRYEPSHIGYPEALPPIEYRPTDVVTTVGWRGTFDFMGRRHCTSKSLHRLPLGIRARPLEDGVYDVYLCHQRIMRIDLNLPVVDT